MSSELISIIAFNRLEQTKACVTRVLEAAKGRDCRIVLHNNASTDGVAEYFDSLFGFRIHVIHHRENTGFQIPTEISFIAAKECGAERIILVNNDCVPPVNFLEVFEAEFSRRPNVAIVGTLGTCCSVGPNLHGYEGGNLEYVEFSCASIDVTKVARHYTRLFEPYISFAYSEDLLLSLKMRRIGYDIALANMHVEHARGSTSKAVPHAKIAQEENHEAMKVHWAHWLKFRTFSHRVLVRRWAATGDVLLVTAILEALWRKYPLCTIHVETLFPELFAGNHFVTSAAKALGREPTDLVIDLDGTYEATPMRHIVRSYAKAADVEIATIKTSFRVQPTDAEWAANKACLAMVAIHAGLSTWPSKNWPIDRWIEVLNYLRVEGYSTVLVGSQRNPELSKHATVDLTGDTTIPQLLAVMARCAFCVSIDSFPLHAAQAVGTPVVGLFGVTTPELICTDGSRWVAARSDKFHSDTGLRHRIAGQVMIQADGSVMETISVQQVIQCIEEIRTPTTPIHA